MRCLLLLGVLAVAGCGPLRPKQFNDAKIYDLLKAYSDNPAAGKREYTGKWYKLEITSVKVRRRGEIIEERDRDIADLVLDTDETIAMHSPGYMTPSRSAVFRFVNETEASLIKPGKGYIIEGRCEGLSGNVVIFSQCTATEWAPYSGGK